MTGALPAPPTSCVWKLLIGNRGSHGIYLLFHQQTASDSSHNSPPSCAIFITSRGLLARLVLGLLTFVQECPSSAFACCPQELHRIPAPLQTLHFTDVLAVAAQGFCSWGNIIDLRYIQVLPDVASVSCGGGDGCTNGNCVVLTDITSFVKQAWQPSLGTFVSYNKHSANWEILTYSFFFFSTCP